MRFMLLSVAVVLVCGTLAAQPERLKLDEGKRSPAQDQRGTEKQPLVIQGIPAIKSKEEAERDRMDQRDRASAMRSVVTSLHEMSIDGRFNLGLVAALVLVGLGQALLFLWQLKELRRATAVTAYNAEAAKMNAEAAEGMLRMTMSAEAPFLIPQLLAFNPAAGDAHAWSTYTFRNEGKTPAIIARFQDRLRFIENLPLDDSEVFDSEPFAERPDQYIAVGAGHTVVPTEAMICRLSHEDIPYLDQVNRRFHLIGRVQYRDRFGTSRHQGFCFLFTRVHPNPEFVRVGGTAYNYEREQ